MIHIKLLKISCVSVAASLLTMAFANIAAIIFAPGLVVGLNEQAMLDTRYLVSLIAFFASLPVYLAVFTTMCAIETKRRVLEKTVRRDDLTGLLSREAFLSDVRADLSSVPDDARLEEAFLIVDADFFKEINDRYGHIAGDQALLAITNALKKGIRSTDRIGRLGGEEFAIQLRRVDRETALEISERLRKNVAEAAPIPDMPDLKLSVSIGAVTYSSKRELVELLIAADKLMYRAKDNGRDRVEYASIEMMQAA
ncbi:MAG: GGDEF domain-containing protein [Pseudomonadota bacterium]